MEDGLDPNGKKESKAFKWLPQVDQILAVGMKYGPKGKHEAVKKDSLPPNFRPLKSGIGCDTCARRRAQSVPPRRASVKTSSKFSETDTAEGAPKRPKQSNEPESCIRDCPDVQCPDLPKVKAGWHEENREKVETDDHGRGMRSRNCLCARATNL
jgi:hypothetical protein